MFFVTIYVGAGLIANDRRANALQVYLSKPLTRAEYVAGKLAILFAVPRRRHLGAGDLRCCSCRSCSPGNFTFLRDNIFLIPAITLFSLLQVLLASMTMLALSSMSKSSRFVGIMYAGPDVLHRGALQRASRHHRQQQRWRGSRRSATLEQLGDVIFRLEPRYDMPRGRRRARGHRASSRVSAFILERRVRGVEVVQ